MNINLNIYIHLLERLLSIESINKLNYQIHIKLKLIMN